MMNIEWEDAFNEEWHGLPPDAIALSESQLAQAQQWSQRGYGEAQQWKIYRHGLALLGLTQWLHERGVEQISARHHSLSNPALANLLNGVVGITVGQYQVALCLQNHESSLALPQLLLQYEAADLYLGVNLWEETGHVQLAHGIWHGDLCQMLSALTPNHQENIEVSSNDLLDADQVLLNLKCATWSSELDTPALPEMIMAYDITLPYLETKLKQWTAFTYSDELLNIQERLQILQSPTLSSKFQQVLSQKLQPSLLNGIDVGQWWNRSLDNLSQELGWIRLPQIQLALRSPDDNSEIVSRLCDQGIDIPQNAQASYQDLHVATQAIRLYAVAWPCEVKALRDIETMDWSLLLVLCTMPSAALSQAIQMEVRDEEQTLATQSLLPHKAQACSYVQVSGTKSERFWVTLAEQDKPDTRLELPPFFFSQPTA